MSSMENDKNHINDLIISFLCGGIDRKGMDDLSSWIRASKENERYFQTQQEIWFSSTTPKELSKYDGEKAFKAFKDKISGKGRRIKKGQAARIPLWMRYAVAITVLVTIGSIAFFQGRNQVFSALSETTIEAPHGSQTKTILPDGTVVWLNAGSKLTYSQAYGLKERAVRLSGEGYFEVKHNARCPFHVYTSSMSIHDLGTRFNLCDYSEDSKASISLEKGGIRLDNRLKEQPPTVMNPGQHAVMDKSTGNLRIITSEELQTSQWVTGEFVLKGDTLPAIARILSHVYGTDVRVDTSSHNDGHFFGEFSRDNESLTEVLNALSATGKMHYSKRGNTYILY